MYIARLAAIVGSIFFAVTAWAQNLSGQVFIQGEIEVTNSCRPQIECDCCTTDLAFISNTEVVIIDRCIHNDIYYRGTYKVSGHYLNIDFSQFIVKENYNEETEKVSLERQSLKIDPITYSISSCGHIDFVLQRTDLKALTRAVRLPADKEAVVRKELQRSDLAKLLR